MCHRPWGAGDTWLGLVLGVTTQTLAVAAKVCVALCSSVASVSRCLNGCLAWRGVARSHSVPPGGHHLFFQHLEACGALAWG